MDDIEEVSLESVAPTAVDIFLAELQHKGTSSWHGGSLRHCYSLPAHLALYVEALSDEMDITRSKVAAHLFEVAMEAIKAKYGDHPALDQVGVKFDNLCVQYMNGSRTFVEER